MWDNNNVTLDATSMVAGLLDTIPSIAGQIEALIAPVTAAREQARTFLKDTGRLHPLTVEEPTFPIGCIDGARIITPLALADHLLCLAVATHSTRAGINIVGHREWSALKAHDPDADADLRRRMLSSELSLIPTMPIGTVTVLDGSFTSHDPNEAADILSSEPFVVACPKSDSHQRLWHECGLVGTALPDKVLAALLLDEGEMLLGDRDFPATDDTDLTTIPVAHLRPFGATTAVTVETSPLLDVFERREVLNVVAADCHPPFTQEPVVQYVTDLFAKDISAIARAQMETARLDAAEHGLDLSLLVHAYRTDD